MAFAGRVDGQAVELHVEPDRLRITGGPEPTDLTWVELDRFTVDGHACRLETFDGRCCTITHLAATRDRFLAEALEARRRARRAALLQWTGDAPLTSFDGRRGDERQDKCCEAVHMEAVFRWRVPQCKGLAPLVSTRCLTARVARA